MTIISESDQRAISSFVILHNIGASSLGGLPDGYISWSVFRTKDRTAAVFTKPTPLRDLHVFFLDSDHATRIKVDQAFKYERGGETRPKRVTKMADHPASLDTHPLVMKTSFAAKQPWAFVDECLQRYKEEILKDDCTVPPFGDSHYRLGRVNTPEHLYSGDGIEVRLHDVSTDHDIERQSRSYWLRIAYGQHEVEVMMNKNWERRESGLHVVERLPLRALSRAA